MGRVIAAFTQFFLDDGTPAINGWLRFLESGTNNTDKATYYDPVYQIPNANPLQLDGAGRCPDVFGTGKYRIISYINDPEDEDSPGEQIQVFDPVTAQVESIESGGAGSFGIWDAAEEYSYGDVVTHSLIYYRSLADGNLGNLPPDTPEKWERVDFLRWWNETISYTTGDLVYYDDNLYLSEADLNLNHQPDISPAWWRPVATGYIEFVGYDEDYTVLPVDRDRILALDPAATTDRTFTLPAGDATTDQYRYGFYNCSATYSLTIHAPGSATLWIDGSDITLDHGALLEIIYCADQDQWLVLSNVGPALGGQDLGTLTTPIENLYLANLFVDNIDAAELHISSDNYAFFGDSDQAQIGFVSATPALLFDIAAGGSYEFYVDSVLAWEFATTGEFLPGASNPNPTVGSNTAPISAFYAGSGFLPDNGAIAFGNSDDLQIWHTGSQANIYNSTGNTVFTTEGTAGYTFVTASGNAMTLSYQGNAAFLGSLSVAGVGTFTGTYVYIGTSNQLRLIHNGANAFIDNVVGNTYLRTGAGPSNALMLSSAGDAYIYNDLIMPFDNNHIYIGASNDADIYFNGSSLVMGTVTAANIIFNTTNTSRWVIDTGGLFRPAATSTYDIGATTFRVDDIHQNKAYTYEVISPSSLVIGINNNAAATDYITITSIVQGSPNTVIYFSYNGGNYFISAPPVP